MMMFGRVKTFSALFMAIVFQAASGSAEEAGPLKTERDRVNYAIGVNFVGNMKRQGVTIDIDLVMLGMRDAAAGGKLLLSDEMIRKGVEQYHAAVRQKRTQVVTREAEDNRGKRGDMASGERPAR
ncbi:FKBP-type peptidyl-prolyl cis-trans isomerase N-terminal domain-containing protein [Geobacter sp. DSM 9736]|uniref:FKBP-type peptidyl-prolyl cis-trans isomerase N-terminal domain-containing protein n=1 Tax=Geobacter sp. DSM 9736 TaxID=1277350 RepID=UPI000B5FFD66|nr:FKBP-type peptidyl-prolyl cis-trans isomerase N-terminal domain-containing protein [Geobacter sp. DSM 9736]SNB47983.1 Domain amino terminal to FKBP-type peptidyl-prolyl isomerase [Geobacter sp. DSM 9736]